MSNQAYHYRRRPQISAAPVRLVWLVLWCALLFLVWPTGAASAADNDQAALADLQRLQSGERSKPILDFFHSRQQETFSPVMLLIKAWALGEAGRQEEALSVYNAVVTLDPDNLAAQYAKAVCLLALHRTAEGEASLAAIGQKWPQSIEWLALQHWTKTGGAAAKSKEKSVWEQEIEQYRPTSLAATQFLADWHFAQRRDQDALKLYKQLQQDGPDNQAPLLREAEILIRRKQYHEAVRTLDRVLAADPQSGAAWRIKGEALAELNKLEEALLCYNKSQELGVDNGRLYLKRGDLFLKRRSFREAIADYTLALARTPDDYLIYRGRYFAYFHLQEQRTAYADLCKATDLAGDQWPEGYFHRGVNAGHLGMRADAIASLEKFLQCAPAASPERARAAALLAQLSY